MSREKLKAKMGEALNEVATHAIDEGRFVLKHIVAMVISMLWFLAIWFGAIGLGEILVAGADYSEFRYMFGVAAEYALYAIDLVLLVLAQLKHIKHAWHDLKNH